MFLKNFSKKVVLGYLTLCLGFSMIGVFYHAGQPLTRGIDGYVAGKRSHFVLAHNRLPYVNLWIEEGDIKLYESIISAIRKEAGEHETIFAIPYNPELYFLADRKNAFSFSFFDQGVINDDDFAKVRKVFQESPPKLVIDSPFDKRQNKSSRLLMRYVKENYQLIGIIGDFRLYRLRTANR